jgi:hypothetical protein
MAEIINLRTARKAKARADKEVMATANRSLFGRTKAEKANQKATAERLASKIDGAKRERPDES